MGMVAKYTVPMDEKTLILVKAEMQKHGLALSVAVRSLILKSQRLEREVFELQRRVILAEEKAGVYRGGG